MSLNWKCIVAAKGPWQLLELSQAGSDGVQRAYKVVQRGEQRRLCMTPTKDGGLTFATRDTVWEFKADFAGALKLYLEKTGSV